jgi:hypothetical protein
MPVPHISINKANRLADTAFGKEKTDTLFVFVNNIDPCPLK